jgi:N-acetylglucosamine-6-phosphate deacetylase
VVSWGISLRAAVAVHSDTPAALLGLPVGLDEGAPADLLVLDDDLALRGVLRAGVPVAGLPLSDALRGELV